MNRWVEPLEGRRLCDAVSSAYTALLADDAAFRNDGPSAKLTLGLDRAAITADVKALPRSAANNRLLARVQSAIASWGRALTVNGSRVPNQLEPYYLKVDEYDSLFQQHPTLRYSDDVRATQISVRTRFNRDLPPLTAAINTGVAPLAAALTALAAANPASDAAELATDLQTAITDEQAITTTGTAQLAKLQADLTTLTT